MEISIYILFIVLPALFDDMSVRINQDIFMCICLCVYIHINVIIMIIIIIIIIIEQIVFLYVYLHQREKCVLVWQEEENTKKNSL